MCPRLVISDSLSTSMAKSSLLSHFALPLPLKDMRVLGSTVSISRGIGSVRVLAEDTGVGEISMTCESPRWEPTYMTCEVRYVKVVAGDV